jgi:hypothetical protein
MTRQHVLSASRRAAGDAVYGARVDIEQLVADATNESRRRATRLVEPGEDPIKALADAASFDAAMLQRCAEHIAELQAELEAVRGQAQPR